MSSALIKIFGLLSLTGLIAILLYVFFRIYRLSKNEPPYVPSTRGVISEIIRSGILPKKGVIMDLGCGNGRALRAFADAGMQGPFIGYEYDVLAWIQARLLCRSYPSITIHFARFERAPLERADALYVFLFKETLATLSTTLFTRLRPGTVVVSPEFFIQGWTPIHTLYAKGVTRRSAPIYVYKSPGV